MGGTCPPGSFAYVSSVNLSDKGHNLTNLQVTLFPLSIWRFHYNNIPNAALPIFLALKARMASNVPFLQTSPWKDGVACQSDKDSAQRSQWGEDSA